jgi:hypothetical protein
VDLTEAARRAADDGVLLSVVAVATNQPLMTAGTTIASDEGDSTDVSRSSSPGSPGLAQEFWRAALPRRLEAEGEDRSRPSPSSTAARAQDVDARPPSPPEASPELVSVGRSFGKAGPKAGDDQAVEAAGRANRGEPAARLAVRRDLPTGSEGDNPEVSHTSAPGRCELDASDSSADMAVKIAKAYQTETLDDIKAGLNAALDYAAEFSRRGAPSAAAKDHGPADSGAQMRGALAAQYRVEAVELMKANMVTTADFARRLLGARSSAEWVELTSTHARLQCELMLQQAQALRSLAQGA